MVESNGGSKACAPAGRNGLGRRRGRRARAFVACGAAGIVCGLMALTGAASAQDAPRGSSGPLWLEPGVDPAAHVVARIRHAYDELAKIQRAFVGTGAYAEAARQLEAYLLMGEAHGMPPALAAEATMTLATARLGAGETDGGLAAIERAIALGFADPVSFHERIPKRVWMHERVRAAYDRMVLTDLDAAELTWARSEIAAIGHDTSALIIANVGRKDRDFTQLAAVTVPTRPTSNPCVDLQRFQIGLLQTRQREQVYQSDQSRLYHLMSMDSIERMGGQVDEAAKLRAQIESRQQAERRYRSMVESIAARQFRAPPRAKGARVSVGILGELGVEPALAPARRTGLDLQFDVRDVQVGDFVVYDVEVQGAGAEPVRSTMKSWVTTTSGPLVASLIVRRVGDSVGVEDAYAVQYASLATTAWLDLSGFGPAEVQRAREEDATTPYRGRELPVKRSTVAFALGHGEERQTGSIVYARSRELPAFASIVEVELQKPDLRIRMRLREHGRAPR